VNIVLNKIFYFQAFKLSTISNAKTEKSSLGRKTPLTKYKCTKRASEEIDQKESRLAAIRKREHFARENEEPNQREARLETIKKRVHSARENEDSSQRAARLETIDYLNYDIDKIGSMSFVCKF